MATQLTKTVNEATDQVVSVIEQVQQEAASIVRTLSEAVAEYVPALGLGEVALAPSDAVETSFGAGARFMDAGRKGALGFLEAVSPVTDKLIGKKSPVKAAAKSA